MNLHRKLLLAQAPLAIALAVVAIVATVTLSSLGQHSQMLLADNYRSVLEMQRAKEALERMDSGALFIVAGRREKGLEQAQANRERVEQAIATQVGNVTEPGEGELTRDLRLRWNEYQAVFDKLGESPSPEAVYFREMEPAFLALKAQADRILDLNQDAMLRRSRSAREAAADTAGILVGVSIAAAIAGAIASSFLTARMLRPVRVLQQASKRIGEGDFSARAKIEGSDEIAALAQDFNGMAERLERYRHSSLGDLLQAQATAQSAIESLPDPVILFGNAGDILNVNHVAESWLGISLEAGGEPFHAAPPAVREVLQRICGHVLGGRGAYAPRGFEESVRVTTAEGERWLLPRASPVYGEGGEIVGVAAILQDVTRLRRFDELKNDLVATVAHEFRTPLISLRMAIHLCVEEVAGPITAKQSELLHAAREDCERLQAIVDDLLDLARIQAGRLELRTKPVLAEQLVEEALDEHRSAAEDAGVRLEATPDPTAGEVLADVERLGLVLSNLVTNAIRHSPREGVVRIGSRPDGDSVRFEVEDQGPGIPGEHRTDIFEKFFRVPGAPSGGAGLGLSISKEIVAAHGGTIGVDSEPERGSLFWFRIPSLQS